MGEMGRDIWGKGGVSANYLDLLVGGRRLELAGEVDDGHVNGGDTEGHAGELPLHLGVALGDRLGRAGRRGDDVDRGGAAGAPVALHGTVDGELGGGGGVDGGHEALLDAELLVDGLDDRREPVRRARGARDHRHRLGVVLLGVDADDNRGRLGVLGRGGDDHLLGATLDVLHAALGRGERAGRLAHVLHARGRPRDLGRVARGGERDGEAVDEEAIVGHLAGAGVAAVDGVVLEEVLHVLGRHRRVDVLEDEGVAGHGDAHDLAADAAEAVDAELDGGVRVGRHGDRRGEAHGSGGEREHD